MIFGSTPEGPTCTWPREHCTARSRHLLHDRGEKPTFLCDEHANRVMYELSLTVPEAEGIIGYSQWRADHGFPPPVRWPDYEPVVVTA